MRFDEKQKETLKRAALLMRTVAEAGCQSFYEDGSPTPNRELHLEIAADLEALAADITLINEGNIEQASPPQWIPVGERLPKENEPVLCFRKGIRIGYYNKGAWFDFHGYEWAHPRTYWMPLPAAPESAI